MSTLAIFALAKGEEAESLRQLSEVDLRDKWLELPPKQQVDVLSKRAKLKTSERPPLMNSKTEWWDVDGRELKKTDRTDALGRKLKKLVFYMTEEEYEKLERTLPPRTLSHFWRKAADRLIADYSGGKVDFGDVAKDPRKAAELLSADELLEIAQKKLREEKASQ